MGRHRLSKDRTLSPRELVSRHRTRLDATGDVRVEVILSKRILLAVEQAAAAAGRPRVRELRLLIEEALAERLRCGPE